MYKKLFFVLFFFFFFLSHCNEPKVAEIGF